ncbi:MAG: GNAT family N-acetyltransferase [Oscillospiraceae bacterium]|nr:GNAT family N-acetyltransferase [Oscillospiraceae bacterium]
MQIRKAEKRDISAVAAIFSAIHTAEEQGRLTIGWVREIYPTEETAQAALDRDDLFVMEEEGRIVASAIINRVQVPDYAKGQWLYAARDDEVMVLHTLCIHPEAMGRGCGKAFIAFYEAYARENGCPYLRMDTNAINAAARAMYRKLGYREAGIVPCVFNGIEGVGLVLLEKYMG